MGSAETMLRRIFIGLRLGQIRRHSIAPWLLGAMMLLPGSALAQYGSDGTSRWFFQTSLATRHFHPDERHDNTQRLLNLEYWRGDSYLYGLALFDNSFGQRSIYGYIGKTWRPFDSSPNTYVKLTGGFLRGYSGEFRDKIPFNHSGIAPAILPSIGYSFGRFSTELVLFGTAGVMWTIGAFF